MSICFVKYQATCGNYRRMLSINGLILWLLLLASIKAFANPVHAIEVRMQDLPAIQLRYGTDSVRQLVNHTPIWLLNRGVALSLLQAPDIRFTEGSWERRYLINIGQDIEATELVPQLEQLLRTELEQAERVNQRKHFVLSVDNDILQAYLHQQPANAETVLAEQLSRYVLLRKQLEIAPRTNFFLRLLGQDLVEWSKASVEGTIYYFLLALHQVNPARYPQTSLEEQHGRVTARYFADNANLFQPSNPENTRTKQIPREEIPINGVNLPKVLADTGECWFVKITESDTTYFLEETCGRGSESSSGYTYLVKISPDMIDLTYLSSWIS